MKSIPGSWSRYRISKFAFKSEELVATLNSRLVMHETFCSYYIQMGRNYATVKKNTLRPSGKNMLSRKMRCCQGKDATVKKPKKPPVKRKNTLLSRKKSRSCQAGKCVTVKKIRNLKRDSTLLSKKIRCCQKLTQENTLSRKKCYYQAEK